MSESRFLRWAAVVADFGSPLYRDERQRDVWNEASAVGFQTGVWLTLLVATVAIWLGGWPALPYVIAFVLVIGINSWLTVIYAARLGVRSKLTRWHTAPRMIASAVLGVVLLSGIVRATWQHSSSTGAGAAVGAVIGAAMALLALRRVNRRRTEFDAVD